MVKVESLGYKLKELRRMKRVHQQDVSNSTGICRSTLSNYEGGKRTPSLKDINKLAVYYGVSLDYFGVVSPDEVFDTLMRVKDIFSDDKVSTDKKDELYRDIMALYLHLRGDNDEQKNQENETVQRK